MFGKNPQRPLDIGDGETLRVQSIFYTLQGEGPFAGRPAVFIRLAGCNLACTYCDTDFESGYENEMSMTEILLKMSIVIDAVEKPSLVVLTGGEPLRQNICPLIDHLVLAGFQVQIETAGTIPLPPALINNINAVYGPLASEDDYGRPNGAPWEDSELVLVCSPKTPRVHANIERYCRHWKYIVRAGDVHSEDGLPYLPTQQKPKVSELALQTGQFRYIGQPLFRRPAHDSRGDTIWLSPCDEQDAVKNAANMKAAVDSCMQFGHRLSLQIHKIVGLD